MPCASPAGSGSRPSRRRYDASTNARSRKAVSASSVAGGACEGPASGSRRGASAPRGRADCAVAIASCWVRIRAASASGSGVSWWYFIGTSAPMITNASRCWPSRVAWVGLRRAAYAASGGPLRPAASEPEDIRRVVALQRIARVDHEREPLGHRRVIEGAVVGADDGTVDAVHLVLGDRLQAQIAFLQRRHVGIGVAQFRTAAMQQFQNVERGRLPHVADVPLVSDAEQMDPRAVDRLLLRIQRGADPIDDVAGHRAVDVTSKLDESAF